VARPLGQSVSLAALLAALIAPGAAAGATTELGGNPLNVHIGDQGELQAYRAGEPNGIF
jgi:hypothetical protein